MGVSTGIPVIGVSGGTPIAVTFAASATTVNLPASGITIASFATGITIGGGNINANVSGSVVLGAGTNSIGSISNSDFPVSPGADFSTTKNLLVAGTAAAGFVVTPKEGNRFARGLTFDNLFFGITTSPVSNIIGVSGSTFYYLKSEPICVTRNYSGYGTDGGFIGSNPSVPLKQGLWIQLTKWDLISHVLVGYTAATQFEFERNAQVLTKEYQIAPIWSHAMDQFRRYPGFTGNNTPIVNNDFDSLKNQTWAANNSMDAGSGTNVFMPAQKQYIGVIEKPTRIFIPTNNAGHVYIQVKGDYSTHGIGAGYWDWETGQWSATTLYERSYFARSFAGFTGSEPNLDTNGNPFSAGTQYDWNTGATPVNGPDGPAVNPGSAIAQILASYTNNPFIRIWGM
jgi:hypothetical protein